PERRSIRDVMDPPRNFCNSQRNTVPSVMGSKDRAGKSVALKRRDHKAWAWTNMNAKVHKLITAKLEIAYCVLSAICQTTKAKATEMAVRPNNRALICLQFRFAMRNSRFNAGELRTARLTPRRRAFSNPGECSVICRPRGVGE